MTSNLAVISCCFCLFGAALLACSGSSTTTTSGTSGGVTPAPSDPVTLPGGGSVPTVACGDESVVAAAGTWDVITTGGRGDQGAGTITVDASSFVLATRESTLSFTVSGGGMTLTWKDTRYGRQDVVPIGVTHAGSAVDTGLLPLAVGGQWSFASHTSGGESCEASLTANGFNATCSKVSTPLGRIEGALVGIRQQEKSSIFGSLGGVWHFTGAGAGSIDATLSGNVLTAVVQGNAGIAGKDGWLTVKLCNGTAAGKASNGLEIAATRH